MLAKEKKRTRLFLRDTKHFCKFHASTMTYPQASYVLNTDLHNSTYISQVFFIRNIIQNSLVLVQPETQQRAVQNSCNFCCRELNC